MGLSSIPPVGTIVIYTAKSPTLTKYGLVISQELGRWKPDTPHLWANWSNKPNDFQKNDFRWISLDCPTLQIFGQEEGEILWD